MEFGNRVNIWLDTLKVELIVLFSTIELEQLRAKDKCALIGTLYLMIIQIALLTIIKAYTPFIKLILRQWNKFLNILKK
jgi:hypothetical protein